MSMANLLAIFGMNWLIGIMKCLLRNVNCVSGDKKMEFDITQFVINEHPRDFSASVMEIGEHAGAYTWQAAIETAADYPFIADDNKEVYQEHLSHFGAWTNEEMDKWSFDEFNALLIQLISSDMREYSDDPISDWVWDEYEKQAYNGQIQGNLFKADGKYYYSISE